MRLLPPVAVLVALTALGAPAAAPGEVRLAQIGTFRMPVHVTAPPQDPDRLYVVEKGGVIRVMSGGQWSTFADLSARVDAEDEERGLLSLAFPPDHAQTRRLYVYLTAPGGDVVIARMRAASPERADPGSYEELLRVPHDRSSSHNGGSLVFGPDGMLYAGLGDGGGGGGDPAANGQNLTRSSPGADANEDPRLGKLLRLDVSPDRGYAQPPDNPFPAPARDVWALGLRNPWRFSFDRATGDLVIGDVGQDRLEEVDLVSGPAAGRGANFGWNRYEGTEPYVMTPTGPGCCTAPVMTYGHTADRGRSIVGGFVVRDPGVPELAGRYLYGDTYAPDVRSVRLSATGATEDAPTGLRVESLVSFGEDACGRVHLVSIAGPVLRLTGAGGGACVRPGMPGSPPAGAPEPRGLTVRVARDQRVLRKGRVALRVRCARQCDVRIRGDFIVRRGGRTEPRPRPLRTRFCARRSSPASRWRCRSPSASARGWPSRGRCAGAGGSPCGCASGRPASRPGTSACASAAERRRRPRARPGAQTAARVRSPAALPARWRRRNCTWSARAWACPGST